ncbi:hypothetical protein PF003_g40719 [Phytophthora fragariae]|nr:hypothetical protein PF003_g40719 [Phytophthora fragariae]
MPLVGHDGGPYHLHHLPTLARSSSSTTLTPFVLSQLPLLTPM